MNKLAILLKQIGSQNSKGGQDTELAHVNPAESRLLKLLGGSGRPDPMTGLKHYDQGDNDDSSGNSYGDGEGNGGYANGDPGGSFDDATADTNAAWGAWDADTNGTQNGSPGRGSGAEDADIGVGLGFENDPFGNPVDNTPGLGTWDFSYGLTPEQQQEHENNVNQSFANWAGYNPSQTTLGDVGNYLSSYLGLDQQAREDAARTAQENENAKNGVQNMAIDENNINYAQAANFNAPGANQWGFTQDQVGKSGNEYNSLGWGGQLSGNPWGYTGLDNESHTNWGSVGRDVADVVTNPVTGAIASAAGLGLPYAAITGAINAARGNYTPGISTLAGLLGGREAALGVNALSGLINGTPGNMLAGQLAGYVNSVAPGYGAALNGLGLTNMAARGIDEAYQTALNDARASKGESLSSDGQGGSDSAFASSIESAPADSGYDVASIGGSFPMAGTGGGGSSDFSDYVTRKDFIGSRKKSRYRRPDSLLALLGGEDAA